MLLSTVHIFITTGRFHSYEEMDAFINPRYDELGEMTPSAFMREVGLIHFEPMCIEAFISPSGLPIPIQELVDGASSSDQWRSQLGSHFLCDGVICVYPPNVLQSPGESSLQYVGKFGY